MKEIIIKHELFEIQEELIIDDASFLKIKENDLICLAALIAPLEAFEGIPIKELEVYEKGTGSSSGSSNILDAIYLASIHPDISDQAATTHPTFLYGLEDNIGDAAEMVSESVSAGAEVIGEGVSNVAGEAGCGCLSGLCFLVFLFLGLLYKFII